MLNRLIRFLLSECLKNALTISYLQVHIELNEQKLLHKTKPTSKNAEGLLREQNYFLPQYR